MTLAETLRVIVRDLEMTVVLSTNPSLMTVGGQEMDLGGLSPFELNPELILQEALKVYRGNQK